MHEVRAKRKLTQEALAEAAGSQPFRFLQAAVRVVRTVVHRAEKKAIDPAVSAAAAALSKLGAAKGGAARAASLSPRKRSEIAKKAAAARWRK